MAYPGNNKVLIALMGMEIGGAETHVLELCKALHRKGMDVYVVSNGGAYERELTDSGIKHYRAPLHNKRPKNILASYLLLRRVIKENGIGLVHAHARIPAFICGLLRKTMDFRLVTTAHLNFNTSLPYKLLTNWGEACLAVSEDIKEYLIKNYGFPADKILLTINGIDTEKFSGAEDFSGIAKEFGLEEGKRRIVYLSRMDTDRSLAAHKLIECAADIYREHEDIEIIIVGGGDDFDKVRGEAAAVNAAVGARLIKVTGNRTDVNKFIASADIFIGGSRAALEAMSAEKPVILAGNQGYIGIFDKNSLDVAVSTNFCCRGCSETETSALKRDVLALLASEPEALSRMGAYNRDVITRHYSVDRMAEDAMALYRLASGLKRPIDVMISGYYGFCNHGDDALLKSITDDLRRVKPDINILVLSQRPRATRRDYDVESIYRFNLPLILLRLRKTKLLITGGGSLIQDMTSTQSLIYYLFVINAAMRAGVANMLYANGIGPLRLDINKRRAIKTLERVDLITLRDDASKTALDELGLNNGSVVVTADPVFGLSNTAPEMAARRLADAGLEGKKYFCVSIRSWKNLGEGFEQDIIHFCSYIRDKYGYEPLFIPMQPQNDAEISLRVMDGVKGGAYLGDHFSVNEILGIAGGAEFLLGMRLHSVIYAASMGTPVIGLVYDPKVEGMMQNFGQQYYLDVKDMSVEELIRYADEVIERREPINGELLAKGGEFRKRVFENAELACEIINGNVRRGEANEN